MSLISPDVSGDLDNWTHIIDGDPTSETQKTKLI